MKKPPFKMRKETDIEKWRAKTFWTKEPETIEWIKGFKGGIFYDIGANIGIYSLYCAAIHPAMMVIAFEPLCANYMALAKNRDLNGFDIEILSAAIGPIFKTVRLIIPNDQAGASGCQAGDNGNVVILQYSLDSIITAYPKPDYIKIDIDGQELGVLQGATEVLKTVKSVLVEIHPKDSAEILSLMNKAGFIIESKFNSISPHSRERRKKEGIPEENIIFTREEICCYEK